MAGGGGAAPSTTQGTQAQVGGFGFGPATQTAINPQAQGGMPLAQQQQQQQQQPAPQQAMQQRAVSPLMQQQMMRQQPQQQMYNPYQQQMMRQQPQQQMYNPYQQQTGGLQAALMQLMGQYNQPMMRQQMPQYGQRPQTNPLAYRPDMSQAQAALSNVKPSVQKTTMDTMQARIAELEAQLAPRQEAYDNSGGG